MDLSKILNVIYRYLGVLILAAFLASVVTFVQLSRQPASYRATTDLLVGPSLDSPSPDLSSLRIGGQLALTYAEVVNTPSFLEAVNNKLEQKININVLKNAISTTQSADTRLLTITVFYPDPNQATAIANAAAQTLLELSPAEDNITDALRSQMSDQSHQLEQIVSNSQLRIKQLEEQLTILKERSDQQQFNATLPETIDMNLEQQIVIIKELGDERSRLSDALGTLASIYEMIMVTNTNQVQIIQPATTATLVDQQLWLRVLSAGLAGLIFALIAIFIAEYFDDRLRFPADLSRVAGAPLLSVIDKYSSIKRNGLDKLVTFAQPNSDAANHYRQVVAKLLFTIGSSLPYTILVSSVGSKNGTPAAVSAGNMAVAFAQAGYKVALVDTQLNNPTLTAIFKAEKKQGLGEPMLAKSTEPQFLTTERMPGIRLLPVGSTNEKNSQAMLNPGNVAGLLYRLQKEADVVLIAGSEISRLAENLTLASQVDSVILVARHAEARSQDLNSVVENLRHMNINIAGVIFDYNSSPSISTKEYAVVEQNTASEEAAVTQPFSKQTTKS